MGNRHSILLHLFAFIVLAVVTVSTPLRAQIVGDRVRLFTADTTIIGQVTGLSDEGFELANDELRRSFAYRDLDRLEVSNGIRSHWARGAAIGGVGGAAVGLIRLPENDRAGACLLLIIVPPLLELCEDAIVETFVPPVVIGVLAGAAVGILFKHESWERIGPWDDTVSISPIVAPHRGLEGRHGLLLGARIEF